MTTVQSTLDDRLSQSIGDYISVALTTNQAASGSVVSTNLNSFDNGRDDYFNGWYCYFTNLLNAGVERKVYDYATSTGTLSVRGANLSADSSTATIKVYKYSYTSKLRAIQDAIRELYPVLYKNVDDRTLVTGDILPDSHFENWSSTSALTFYSALNGTLAQTSTAGYTIGGKCSAKLTASSANGYMYIHSNTYPRLLDIQGETISLYCWVYSEVDNDAWLEIVTQDTDGTTQTLTSTTPCTGGRWTLLKLEDQAINKNLVVCIVKFGVTTNAKYVYFDHARLVGADVHEYLIPNSAKDGTVRNVSIQVNANSDEPCDDLFPQKWNEIYGWEVVNDGTYKYLRLPYTYANLYQIRIEGDTCLEVPTAYSDTVSIDGEKVNLLIAYAAYKLFLREEGIPSSDDKARFKSRASQWLGEFYRLKSQLMMSRPASPFMFPLP
jgi:hypothetical protein